MKQIVQTLKNNKIKRIETNKQKPTHNQQNTKITTTTQLQQLYTCFLYYGFIKTNFRQGQV